jgi:uncharacterized protein (DUF1697 family)
MTRCVAFLRGINVGGRSVQKEKLVVVFDGLGFQGVETFRQSGNVVFESSASGADVGERIGSALQEALGYEVTVFLRAMGDLRQLVDGDPFRGRSDENASFLVTFLQSSPSPFPLKLPFVIPKSTAVLIGARSSEVFSVTHGGGEGALPNPFIESRLKTRATTRNMNVIREIVERLGG